MQFMFLALTSRIKITGLPQIAVDDILGADTGKNRFIAMRAVMWVSASIHAFRIYHTVLYY
jgi:hypothetical protein